MTHPLTAPQREIWLEQTMHGDSPLYTIGGYTAIHGPVDPAVFARAVNWLARKHDALRLVMRPSEDSFPRQALLDEITVSVPLVDVSGQKDPRAAAMAWMRARMAEPFERLDQVLFRYALLKVEENRYYQFGCCHHLILDGWSVALLNRSLAEMYTELMAGREPDFDSPSYATFIAFDQQLTASPQWQKSRQFWRGLVPPEPLCPQNPSEPVSDSAEQTWFLSRDLYQKLDQWARDHQTSLPRVLLGALCVYWSRVGQREDIAIGLPMHNRGARFKECAGLFATTYPARFTVDPAATFSDLLAHITTTLQAGYRHQRFPLSEIKRASTQPEKRLFDIRFTYLNQDHDLTFAGAPGRAVQLFNPRDPHPLSITVEAFHAQGDVKIDFVYQPACFSAAEMAWLPQRLNTVLETVLTAGARPIGQWPVMSGAEVEQLRAWNATDCALPGDTVVDAFDAQARQCPDRIAVVFGDQTLTYRGLREKSDRLAARIFPHDTPLVGIFTERSVEMVVGLLAIWKAGKAYLPLDPEYPPARLAFLIEDSQVALVLIQAELRPRFPVSEVTWIALEDEGPEANTPPHPDDLAYVIYTSGSTGLPKGAMNGHRGLRNRLSWMQADFPLTEQDRVLQKTPLSFDISVWEIFWPLITGARLVLAQPGGHRDPAYLARVITEHKLTTLHFVPSMLRAFLDADEPIPAPRQVFCTGEALSASLRDDFLDRFPTAELVNLYGPTEAAIEVTWWRCREALESIVPIGRPGTNTRIHILDAARRPLPIGVAGELCIAGVPVGVGYWHRPETTAEKFFTVDVFGPSERVYATGDRARWRADGVLEFLGRLDDQIKLRGNRIELGEIEAVLARHPAVHEAVVVAREQADHTLLVAYFTALDAIPDASDLRAWLRERLPEPMVPSGFVALDALPLTPNGKRDRLALAARDFVPETTPRQAPRDEREQCLAEIWSAVLKIDSISVHDHFFQLGGDSILAIQVVARVKRAGYALEARDLLRAPVLADLAKILRPGVEPTPIPAEKPAHLPPELEDAFPLAATQAGMVFHAQMEADPAMYQVVITCHLRAVFDESALRAAMQAAMTRHPILRARFRLNAEPRQEIVRQVEAPLSVAPMAQDAKSQLAAWIEAEKSRGFAWDQAPLFRVQVHRDGEERFYCSLSFHHVILDGWSAVTLLTEFLTDYPARLRGSAADFPPPRALYRDFVALEQHAIANRESRDFWQTQLAGLETTPLPRATAGSPEKNHLHRHEIPLEPDWEKSLAALALQLGFSRKTLLLTAWLQVIGLFTNQPEVATALVVHGRAEETDGDRVLGLFLNALPLRARFAPDESWEDAVRQVAATETALFPHRRFPQAEMQRLFGVGRIDTLFIYTHFHVYRDVLSQNEVEVLEVQAVERTHFPLVCHARLHPVSQRLSLVLEGNVGLLEPALVDRVGACFFRMLQSLVAHPERAPDAREWLGDADGARLRAWNQTAHPHPSASRIDQWFFDQASATPEGCALIWGEHSMTYRELAAQVTRLADALRPEENGDAGIIGVFLDPSPEWVVAMLAIFRVGGVYWPLDPGYPAERLRKILETNQPRLILTQQALRENLSAQSIPVIALDQPWPAFPNASAEVPKIPNSVAYLIHTSGSTGQPKAVMGTHAGLQNRLQWMWRKFPFAPDERMAAKTAMGFVDSLWEVLGGLLQGVPTVLIPREARRDPQRLAEILAREKVTRLVAVPSLIDALLRLPDTDLNNIRLWTSSGEALTPSLAERFFHAYPNGQLLNLYGASEVAADVLFWPVEKNANPVLLGKPLDNVRAYVLDDHLRPQPLGAPGELCIAGEALAAGYFRQPDSDRFVEIEVLGQVEKIYRTGDQARWRADGNLEFLGRRDRQLKLRGFRVELGEIEAVLTAHPRVDQAVVVARDERLAAYVTLPPGKADFEETDRAQWLAHARRHLPDYLVPASFTVLAEFPRNAHGKLDRAALPAPALPPATSLPPRNETEQSIAQIWSRVLQREAIGVDDNFFDLGGHSLALTQVFNELREAHPGLRMVDLFSHATVRSLATFLTQPQVEPKTRPRPQSREEPIAIIGMAGRFPQAPDVDALWTLIREGREAIQVFSEAELRAAGVDPAQCQDPNYVRSGTVLADADCFDADFFHLSARDAEVMDPQQRVFLEAAWHALEHAGYPPGNARIGLFAGCGENSYARHCREPSADDAEAYRQYTLNSKDFLATRVAYKLNLSGPAVTVQTACSTSLVAVHQAAQSLKRGECDVALAGGVSIFFPQGQGIRHQPGMIFSRDGHCRAFDAAADGTAIGRGVGVVVLKPWSQAQADGDTIHAVLRGSAINNDGADKVGFTAPGVVGQREVIVAAHAAAGVSPEEIGYIEAHGTGTPLGDPIEIQALTEAFATDRRQFCALGSVKTNLGHADTAAGIAGLLKAVLALKHRYIPPLANFTNPHPDIDFANSPFVVPTHGKDWASPRIAGVSSFGIGGTNAHAVVAEAPPSEPTSPGRTVHLLTLSAKTAPALHRARDNLQHWLAQNPEAPLAEVAHTLNRGRREFVFRQAWVCADREEALAALSAEIPEHPSKVSESSVAFLFPGQGTQFPGMGRELYATEPGFREPLDQCADWLTAHLDRDLRDLLFNPAQKTALAQTRYVQPALFALEYALARLWLSWGIRPTALLGHSLGEFVAACVAEVFSLADGLKLVAERGRLMQQAPAGAMLAVALSETELDEWLQPDLSLATVNGPKRCVVAGSKEAIAALANSLRARGVESRPLAVHHAFHSHLLDAVPGAFAATVRQVALQPPKIPLLSNVSGTWLRPEEATNPDYWASQLRQTVRFGDNLTTLCQQNPSIVLEVGPGRVLSNLVRHHAASRAVVTSLPDPEAHEPRQLLAALGQLWSRGVAVDWDGVYHGQRRRRIPLPTYPFERTKYWIDPPVPKTQATELPAFESWLSRPVWRPEPPPETESSATKLPEGPWLVFTDSEGITETLGAWLEAQNQSVIYARMGESFARLGPNQFSLQPGQEADFLALVQALEAGFPRQIVQGWRLDSLGNDSISDPLNRGFYSLLALAKAWGSRPVTLHILAKKMFPVAETDPILPINATALGAALTIPLEYPRLRCRVIDLDATTPVETWARELKIKDWDNTQHFVAYRQGTRWLRSFESLPPAWSASYLRPRSVVLITGGLGGMGLTLARHLARAVQARLILVGRSAFPAREQWPSWLEENHANHPVSAQIRALQALESLGSEILVCTADVADAAAMENVVATGLARFGGIHGVIHAAGVADGALIARRTREDSERIFAAKLHGTLNLAQAFQAQNPLDFFVLCASLSGLTGAPGQAAYCAANAFLDAFAEGARMPNTLVTAINWDSWRQVGMAAAMRHNGSLPQDAEILDHPWFFAQQRNGEQITFFSRLDERLWVLDEHRILGPDASVMPGTGFVAWLFAAWSVHTGQDAPVVFRDWLFFRPLVIPNGESTLMRITLVPQDAGFAFQVHAQATTWREHVRGWMGEGEAVSQKTSVEALRPAQARKMTKFDATLTRFGPRWRNLVQVWVDDENSEGLAELRLPSAFQQEDSEFPLHPGLLDIALGFLGHAGVIPPAIPMGYRRMAVHAPLPVHGFSHARVRAHAAGTWELEVRWLDPSGNLLGEVEGLTLREVSAEAEMLLETEGDAWLGGGLTPEEGAAIFDQVLHYSLPRVVVAKQGLDTVMQRAQRGMISTASARPAAQRPPSAPPFVAPETEWENRLAVIWQDFLGVDPVGAADDFFDLGGDSLLVTQLTARVREQFQLEMALQVAFEHPKLRDQAAWLAAQTAENAENPLHPQPADAPLVLSLAQQRMWFLEQFEIDPDQRVAPYNLPAAFRLQGELGIAALRQTFRLIVERHQSLRLRFFEEHGEVKVAEIPPYDPFEIHDLRQEAPETRESQARALADAHAARPFDLSEGRLLRLGLVLVDEQTFFLLFNIHHIISDVWSLGVLVREWTSGYAALVEGNQPDWPKLPVRYSDYAAWQRAWLRGEALQRQLDYWQTQLADAPALLELPTDFPRPPIQSHRGGHFRTRIDAELGNAIKALGRAHDATWFMTLLAAFQTLLFRYSGQDDICVGSPIANRPDAQLEPVIGLFLNILVLRARFPAEISFVELLGQTRQTALDAYAWQDIPFEHLLDNLDLDRGLDHNPLFQVMFIQDNIGRSEFKLPGVSLEPLEQDAPYAKYDLTVSVLELGDEWMLLWEYSEDLFRAETVHRLAEHYEMLLRGIVQDPECPVHALPLLSEAEIASLRAWNQTARDFPSDTTVVDAFERQATQHPERVALVVGEHTLSYQALDQQANQLAHQLVAQKLAGKMVGICLEYSEKVLVAMLAVLKAGAAYLPLDPGLPDERLAYVLTDSEVPLVLTTTPLASRLSATEVLCLDTLPMDGIQNPPPRPRQDLAYVIYTSGSSGRPKGVKISLASLTNAFHAWREVYRLDEIACHLQLANPAFDVFTGDWVRALCSGAKLVMCPRETLVSAMDLAALIQTQKIECVEFTPGVVRPLMDFLESSDQGLDTLRYCIVGSEAWQPREYDRLARLCGPKTQIINSYGVTEATVDSTIFHAPSPLSASNPTVPIGQPMPNVRVHILDAYQQPVPLGVPGELCIAGAGLAQGYCNRPDLDAEKFREIQCWGQPERIYRTGDRARWLADGNLEYLGRMDRQIKLRGFRIELGEIEAVLTEHAAITQAAVVSTRDRLAAYLVLQDTSLEMEILTAWLKKQLPEPMIPSTFTILGQLPLTPNGKLNIQALPIPEYQPQTEITPPSTATEQSLTLLWSELLQVEVPSITTSFFALGGHSLLATRLQFRIREQFDVEIPVRVFFENPTVQGLARVIDSDRVDGVMVQPAEALREGEEEFEI